MNEMEAIALNNHAVTSASRGEFDQSWNLLQCALQTLESNKSHGTGCCPDPRADHGGDSPPSRAVPDGRGIEQSHSSVTNIPASVNQRPSAPAPTDQTNPTRQEDDGDEVAIVWTKSLEPSSNRNAFVFKNVLRIPETFGTCDPSHDRGVQDVEVMIAAAILFNMGVLLHIANQNGGEATLARASHLYQRSCNALLLFQERSILRRISNKSSSHHDFCPDTTMQTMMKVFSHFMLIAVLNNVATICYECGHYEMAREYAHVMVHRIHVFSPETTGSPRQHTQTQPLGSSDALFWRKEMQDFLMNAMVLGRTPTMASAA